MYHLGVLLRFYNYLLPNAEKLGSNNINMYYSFIHIQLFQNNIVTEY